MLSLSLCVKARVFVTPLLSFEPIKLMSPLSCHTSSSDSPYGPHLLTQQIVVHNVRGAALLFNNCPDGCVALGWGVLGAVERGEEGGRTIAAFCGNILNCGNVLVGPSEFRNVGSAFYFCQQSSFPLRQYVRCNKRHFEPRL